MDARKKMDSNSGRVSRFVHTILNDFLYQHSPTSSLSGMTESPGPIPASTLLALRSLLLNLPGNVPLAERFRKLFTLKNIGKFNKNPDLMLRTMETPEILISDAVVHIIAQGFTDPSALLKHELAYVLGQMGNPGAIKVLEGVLQDEKQDAMVRHEVCFGVVFSGVFLIHCFCQAAEALGALSSASSEPLLRQYLNDKERCVRETCQVALARIDWARSNNVESKDDTSPSPPYVECPSPSRHFQTSFPRQFTSTDPAPPEAIPSNLSNHALLDQIKSLQQKLTCSQLPLFDRYRAMFALRDIAGSNSTDIQKAAVDALTTGFDDDSELFKYVRNLNMNSTFC